MIIVRIIGGLGNQLFQYAAALKLSKKYNVDLKFDLSDMSRYYTHNFRLNKLNFHNQFIYFEHSIKFKLKFYLKLIFKKNNFFKDIYVEKNFLYNEEFENLASNTYLYGYFQSPKYFSDIRHILINTCRPNYKFNEINNEYIKKINQTNSVAIHIRRGDYVSNQKANKIHGFCSKSYYQSAIIYINSKVINPTYFIFSDDINWVKCNLNFDKSFIVDVNSNLPEMDLYLISKCKYHIISNSTFSWWGAWLCQYEKNITIAPKPWFDSVKLSEVDLIPENWIRLSKN